MTLIIVSFFAWVLTILAPCVLPLLPIILWASIDDPKDKYRPYIIIASLSFSVFVFSLLLKASTIFIDIDPIVWKLFSGVILILFWVFTFFPNLWKNISNALWFSNKSNKGFQKSTQKKWITGSILVWMSLGPVFSSCSPTYALILAVILPISLFAGLINLIAYILWLALVLLLIALLGQKFIKKVKWASDPKWKFKKILWIIFVLVWVAIISWFDKKIESKIIESWYFDVTGIEQMILDRVDTDMEKKKELPLKSPSIEGGSWAIAKQGESEIEQEFLRDGLKTNTESTSISLRDVLDGGPGKDGIPAINEPKFVDIETAKTDLDFLKDDSRWISVQVWDAARFYPYAILVWHEIVNDILWDEKISVTFCPLCWSAIVYNRVLNWEEHFFGVSGKLYQSNLLMYDDKTESLWSQSLWEALVWDYLGQELEYMRSNLMTFAEFEKQYPQWEVLSDDTWYFRSYGRIPYGSYDENDTLYFPVKNQDLRFHKKELFYIVNNKDLWESTAFLFKDLREEWEWTITVWENTYEAIFKDGIVEVTLDWEIQSWYYEMWFSWITHNKGSKNVWFKSLNK